VSVIPSAYFAGAIIDRMSEKEPTSGDRDPQVARLLSRWTALLPLRSAVGVDVVDRYAEPIRHYHGLDHLEAVLDAVDALASEAAGPRLVRLAAWYHDAVYDVRRDDNEEQSARLAERTLTGTDDESLDVAEVARLVRLTATHDPAADDSNGAVLCDADLSVLAGDRAGYAAYVSAVRTEYGHVSDEAFRSGRAAVLEQLLAMPTVYRTAAGRSRWEAPARRNLRSELARLRP
jgi:predicted metal-dependent HD superfamily phosphohydrolase